jgi:hypothetical protein
MKQLNGTFPAVLADADTAGGILALPNPEGQDFYITRVIVDVTTRSTGACTVDAGIAAGATTSADNLIDGLSAAAVGTYENQVNGGTNGKAGQKWAADQFLTISRATGAAAGLRGKVYVEYVRLS